MDARQDETISDGSIAEKILLLEYQKLMDSGQVYHELVEKRLQFYISILSAGFGLLILLQQQETAHYDSPYITISVLAAVLVIGILSYASIVTSDFYLIDRLQRRKRVLRGLTGSSRLEQLLQSEAVFRGQDPMDYGSWSSLRALIQRAVFYGGAKTLIGLGNSIVAGIVAMIIIGSQLSASSVSVPVLVGGLACFAVSLVLHVAYAHVRYHFGLPEDRT